MSPDTQDLIRLCERLPERERAEVADFARFLLAKAEATDARAVEQWLASAVGAATPGVTTDDVMRLTRGDA